MMLYGDCTELVHVRRLDHDFCPAVPKTPRKKPHHSSVFNVKRNMKGSKSILENCFIGTEIVEMLYRVEGLQPKPERIGCETVFLFHRDVRLSLCATV